MTQEEKNLLLQDLCARLPFHVKVAIDFKGYLEVLPSDKDLEYTYRKNLNFILDYEKKTIEDISKEPHILYAYPCSERFAMLRGYTYELDYGVPVEFIKPYLRPMSTLTAEEKEEMHKLLSPHGTAQYESDGVHTPMNHYGEFYPYEFMWRIIDWLNAHHFDYNGLIEKCLALEAPDNMYK